VDLKEGNKEKPETSKDFIFFAKTKRIKENFSLSVNLLDGV